MLSVLAVCVSKEPHPPRKTVDGRGINISGVDFWHAVEFSRNGRFLRPDQNSLAGSSGLPFGVSDSIRRFRVRFPVGGISLSGLSAFRRVRL